MKKYKERIPEDAYSGGITTKKPWQTCAICPFDFNRKRLWLIAFSDI
jgi:hypothetical protein